MLSLDPLILARMQFSISYSSHIIFPTITLALSWVVLFLRIKFQATKDDKWIELFFFWSRLFALCFTLGIISTTALSFQFGSNWPGFMRFAANIAGPLFTFEILTTMVFVVGFLSILLFGFNRLSSSIHIASCVVVALGTSLSVFWNLVLNSWMHTPLGFIIYNGEVHAASWINIIFNPSMHYRVIHTFLASGMTTAFIIAGVGAIQFKKCISLPQALINIKLGLSIAAVLAPLQFLSGQLHLQNTLDNQPAKAAAIQGNTESYPHSPYVFFPVLEPPQNKAEIAETLPPATPVYLSFRVMILIGILMFAVSWYGFWTMRKNKTPPKILIKILIPMTFSGWIATLAGWYVTEIGRQPWLIQGILKTADAAAHNLSDSILISLLGYSIVYLIMITGFLLCCYQYLKKPNRNFSNFQKNEQTKEHPK